MKDIKETFKKLVMEIKKYITKDHRRYTFDKDDLTYKSDKLIKRLIIFFSVIVVSLVIFIMYLKNEVDVQRNISFEHYKTISCMMDNINEEEYTQSEMLLYTEIGMVILDNKCEPCTKENICRYIDTLAKLGIVWFPDIMKSNCQIESGFGTSNVGKKCNNLFGMDHPNIRNTLSTHATGRFATFKNWKCSILDRVLWDYAVFKKKKPSKEEYLHKMNVIYNTNSDIDYAGVLLSCKR